MCDLKCLQCLTDVLFTFHLHCTALHATGNILCYIRALIVWYAVAKLVGVLCATSLKVVGLIPDPCGHTMALESTQPLTELSMGGGGGVKAASA